MKSVKFMKKKKKWFNPIEVIHVFLMLKVVFPIVQKESLQDVRKLSWYFGLLLCYQLWKYHRSRLNSSFLGLFVSAGRYNYESSDKPVSLQDAVKICTRSTSSWQCWNDVAFQKRWYWQSVWHYGYLWIIPKKFVYALDVIIVVYRELETHLKH